ncbi:family 78 glycoside hydrolase catalytic domain [Nesterenkonia halotolerans]|uniref:family 78 glycoside hydrolase catalytic domain n=1 Tax=Nesterenkonia halotolerans TaxID=225325 RepID=UPI003EE49F5C
MTRIDGAVRVEHHSEPMGIGERSPRLSWKTAARPGWQQLGYELEVGLPEGPQVFRLESAEQVLVPWPARALVSRERVSVRVRVTGDDGDVSSWSEPTVLETGLLEPADWSAAPVRAPWAEDPDSDRRPPLLRRAFTLEGDIASARLYATAHGVYEAEINGVRVGRDILAPGWTVYDRRLRYQTYDVTEHLRAGENAIGAWMADGWYRGRLGFNGGHRNLYGSDLSLIAQLEVTYADGRRETISTDELWRASFGPVRFSGLYEGETYVVADEQPGWSAPAFDDASWAPVLLGHRDPGTFVAPDGEPIRCTEELVPQSVTRLPNGRLLVDFGQNLVGRLRIRVAGEAGTTVTMRHSEVLQNGTLYLRPLRQAAATDTLILDGAGEREWEPRFTYHGFRYAELEGWPGEFTAGKSSPVVARVYHTDMRRTGWFESSDLQLNRLHENVLWSMRGNFVDVPTDCPQRDERLGWTGDIQVFAPTASFLYDCAGMLSSWLSDLAEEQLEDGTVPWYVPVIPGGRQWTPIQPGAAWGDAAVLVPWTLYQRFGDADVLRRQYPSAKAWVDLVAGLAGEDHLWNTGRQLGDWLDPDAPPTDPAGGKTESSLVATAYFAWSARTLARSAEVLGYAEDAAHYTALARRITDAFLAAHVRHAGGMTSDSQTAYALAIHFELLPAELRAPAGDRLAELVRASGNKISTGFVGTPIVADALTATGHIETAYGLLLEEECPSWLYTVRQGGTTIWERWDSMLPDGTINPGEMTSFNHYALGSVADWMHRVIAGLSALVPGYREVLIAPRPGGGLTRAAAQHETPYGRIALSWTLEAEQLCVEVVIPTGVTARVDIPGIDTQHLGSGEHVLKGSWDSVSFPGSVVRA